MNIGESPSILVVEDDEDLSELLVEILHMRGLSDVAVETDGRSALERLEKSAPDLLVLDIHLPFVSGLEILAYMRGRERLSRTKVAVVTADAAQAEALSGSVALTVLKPIGLAEIGQIVELVAG